MGLIEKGLGFIWISELFSCGKCRGLCLWLMDRADGRSTVDQPPGTALRSPEKHAPTTPGAGARSGGV
jgi:hypothetical protein